MTCIRAKTNSAEIRQVCKLFLFLTHARVQLTLTNAAFERSGKCHVLRGTVNQFSTSARKSFILFVACAILMYALGRGNDILEIIHPAENTPDTLTVISGYTELSLASPHLHSTYSTYAVCTFGRCGRYTAFLICRCTPESAETT